MTRKRRAPLYEDRQYMDLHWESVPDEFYVRGHVSAEEFAEIYNDYYQLPPEEHLVVEKVSHEWGRFLMNGHGDPPQALVATPERTRSSFPVTVFYVNASTRARGSR